jgi:hypothetical protein
MVKKLIVAAAFGMLASQVQASLLLYEPFNYNTGNLNSNVAPNGNTWYSSAASPTTATTDFVQVTTGNLSYTDFPAAAPGSLGNSVTFGNVGRTDRIAFTTQTSGTVWFSVLLNITDLRNTAAAGGFIAGFNNTPQTAANDLTAAQPGVVDTRLIIKTIAADALGVGTYQIGLDKSSGTAANFQFDAGTYSTGSTVLIVGNYTFNTGSTTDDVSKLWINPSSSTFGNDGLTPGSNLTSSSGNDITGGTIATFILRQNQNVVPAGVQMDELRVGTSWTDVTAIPEPATAGLLCVAGLGLLGRRKRR